MTLLLKVTGLTVKYGGKVAVDAVALEVGEREIVTIVGHNGAGKSSLLTALHGHVPAEGRVEFDGQDITRWSPEERLHAGLALVPQGHQVFRGLKVRENLEMAGLVLGGAKPSDLESVFAMFPRLKERAAQRAGTLSGGEQQMLAIGMGLMVRPRLLLVDEPTIGLAPALVKRVMEALTEARSARGCSVLLVEQNIAESLAIADRAYGMRRGEFVAASAATEFTQRFDLMEIM
ncbi:MAG: transporter related [Variovorax sp.]|jgi:branched-chain amino acid transport system ATP-binding protein|nr:transporter related [Variovorax sp.]